MTVQMDSLMSDLNETMCVCVHVCVWVAENLHSTFQELLKGA